MLRRGLAPALIALVVVGGFTWARAQQPRAGSLTAQDYIDIQQLYARYNVAIDGGDAEAYADTFTPDGVFNTFSGRKALIEFVAGYKEKNQSATRRHWNTNLVITPSAEGATGTVYLFLMDIASRPPAIATVARYDDLLVKTPQGWRFKQRKTRGDQAPAPKPVQ